MRQLARESAPNINGAAGRMHAALIAAQRYDDHVAPCRISKCTTCDLLLAQSLYLRRVALDAANEEPIPLPGSAIGRAS